MAQFPGLDDEDDDLDSLGGLSAPATSIAGPQTPSDAVKQRIRAVKTGFSGDEDSARAAMNDQNTLLGFQKDNALTSGLGRALNAIASGSGYKPDNSLYDAMDKQPAEIQKSQDLASKVRQAIADRAIKSQALQNTQDIANAKIQASQASNDAKSKNALAQIQAYKDRTAAMGNAANTRQTNSTIRTANTVLNDKNAQTEVKKLEAARGAQSLVDSIRSGDVKDSKNVAKQLTNMITTIELGAPGGQGDRQAMGVDTLYGKLKGALGYVEGKPEGVIPSDYLNQLESETHALGDRAAKNYKNITDSALQGADLSGGNPDIDPGQVHTLAKQRRDTLLKTHGYDPETGESSRKASKSASVHKPGDVVAVKGKQYRVGADGDSLEPI